MTQPFEIIEVPLTNLPETSVAENCDEPPFQKLVIEASTVGLNTDQRIIANRNIRQSGDYGLTIVIC